MKSHFDSLEGTWIYHEVVSFITRWKHEITF